MSTPHRATPEQWHQVEQVASIGSADCSCLLELRARIKALEATQHAHADLSHLSGAEQDRMAQELAKPAAWRPLETEITYGSEVATASAQQILRAPMVVEGTFEHGGETYRFKAKPEREAAMTELRAASAEARPAKPPADDTRALLLWLLWHHQGARSDVGQPIRDLLGMGRYEPMSDEQLQIAREWGDRWLRGGKKVLAQLHPAPIPTAEARPSGLVERVAEAMQPGTFDWSAYEPEARAAIREVAAALLEWHDSDQLVHTAWEAAKWLQREADRG